MSEHKANKPAVTVVETPTRMSKLRARVPARRNLIKIGVIAVIVASVGFGAYSVNTTRVANEEARRQAEASKPKKLSKADYDWERNNVAAGGDPKSMVKLTEGQVDDSMERRIDLASAYANDKQYDRALAIYDEELERNRLTSNYLMGAGAIATQAKQNERAIKYYEQAITLAKTEKDDNPTWEGTVTQAEAYIAELKR